MFSRTFAAALAIALPAAAAVPPAPAAVPPATQFHHAGDFTARGCAGPTVYTEISLAAARSVVPPEFEPASRLGLPAVADLFVHYGPCAGGSVDGAPVGSIDDETVGISIVPPAGHPAESAAFVLWQNTSSPALDAALRRAGQPGELTPGVWAQTRRAGPAAASRMRQAGGTSPYRASALAAAPFSAPAAFTLWAKSPDGRYVRSQYELSDFAYAAGPGAVLPAPGTLLARLIGAPAAPGLGLFQTAAVRAVVSTAPAA